MLPAPQRQTDVDMGVGGAVAHVRLHVLHISGP